MKARIDKTKCVGCGVCTDICPEGIEMVGEIAEIKDENAGCLKDAANACPQKAIIFNGEKSDNEIGRNFDQNYGQDRRINQGMGRGAGKGRGLGRGPRDGRGGGRGGGGRRRW